MTEKTLKGGKPGKKRLKVRDKGKSYPIEQCAFYKLRSIKTLANLLFLNVEDIIDGAVINNGYRIYDLKSKNGKYRTIEEPIGKLDTVHTRIASLLCRIELPEYLHSGRKKHSNVTNAKQHLGDFKVLTCDIKQFYPSTKHDLVRSFYKDLLKCSSQVSEILTALTTCNGHIPTGSRLSMPLSFWANYRMFSDLLRLCEKSAIRMTIYVDDMTFSGNNVNKFTLFKIKAICNIGLEVCFLKPAC